MTLVGKNAAALSVAVGMCLALLVNIESLSTPQQEGATGSSSNLLFAHGADVLVTSVFGTIGEYTGGELTGVARTADSHLTMLISDTANHAIYSVDTDITSPTYKAKTLIIGTVGTGGNTDGVGTGALLNGPEAMVWLPTAKLWYVCNTVQHAIREIGLDYTVTHRVGSTGGSTGSTEGVTGVSELWDPQGMVVSSDDNIIYIVDSNNHRVRAIDRSANFLTSLVAGSGSGNKYGTGSGARFKWPRSLIWRESAMTHLILADRQNDLLKLIDPATQVVTWYACSGSANVDDGTLTTGGCKYPWGMVRRVGSSGDIFITSRWADTLQKVSPSGDTITLITGVYGTPGLPPTSLTAPGMIMFNGDETTLYIAQGAEVVVLTGFGVPAPTPQPPTPEPTPVPPPTPAPPPPPTPTKTLSPTATAALVPTTSATWSATVTPAATVSATQSGTITPADPATATATRTETVTPAATSSVTTSDTVTPAATPSGTQTETLTPATTRSTTDTATVTPAATASATETSTVTPASTQSDTRSETVSPPNTVSATSTETVTPAATASATPSTTVTPPATRSTTQTETITPLYFIEGVE